MSTPVISVENISKLYRIGHRDAQDRNASMRDIIAREARNATRKMMDVVRGRQVVQGDEIEEYWALRDVSFNLHDGDVLGIVGRNGAGKSTILKVLSRITEPTSGCVTINGRVASLLEVGTGFHPELTGRENIFLNGAILGMSRADIRKRFDEIVAFSEIEKFLDTPVKRYSSGMYVRLAFAVAAHLEPEILIVDEVLAVGDVTFQAKCLGKMGEVANSGRAVLFVSHNTTALESLCRKGVVLEGGHIVHDGSMKDALAVYHKIMRPDLTDFTSVNGEVDFKDTYKYFKGADLVDAKGKSTRTIPMYSTLRVRLRLETKDQIDNPIFVVVIENASGQKRLTIPSPKLVSGIKTFNGGCEVSCVIERLPLAPGDYKMLFALEKGNELLEATDRVIAFNVHNADAFDDGFGYLEGVCVAPGKWQLTETVSTEAV